MRSIFNLNIFLFLFFYFLCIHCIPDCEDKSVSYLDLASALLEKAKSNYLFNQLANVNFSKWMDCEEVQRVGYNTSGVYTIWPKNRLFENKSLDVYCDMDTDEGGWIVIQRRNVTNSTEKEFFYKDWKSYKEGFGDIKAEFWLGNDNIFALSQQRQYSIRFDLKDFDGKAVYALYDSFWIDDESNKYMLHIGGYTGDAGDSMISSHDNMKFSTKDEDNDTIEGVSCSKNHHGAWWYSACYQSNLNGFALPKDNSGNDGINWYAWTGYYKSLAFTEIKIRPKFFRKKV